MEEDAIPDKELYLMSRDAEKRKDGYRNSLF